MLVLIDNYDSFTWNLVQSFGDLGQDCTVIRNDKAEIGDVLNLNPDGIVISPGPGDPDQAGICLGLIAAAAERKLPLLGVCLGHQAMGQVFGGRVIRAPQPMHGKTSDICHTNESVFRGLPSPCRVTRYHSLIVERQGLPDVLSVTAESEDGLIMGLAHKTAPLHGVQFHPESIETESGLAMLRNFTDLMAKAAA